MNKMRNCYSPPGMGYSLHGTEHIKLKDCPRCKYGTIDPIDSKGKSAHLKTEEHTHWKCADCGATFTVGEIK